MTKITEPTVTERVSANIFIRECRLPKVGDMIPCHVHTYDHTMFFMTGKVKVRSITQENEVSERILKAPFDALVPAGIKHEITALTDNVWFSCVFPHRDAVGKITLEPVSALAYW